MKRNIKYLMLSLAMSMVLTACNSTVSQSQSSTTEASVTETTEKVESTEAGVQTDSTEKAETSTSTPAETAGLFDPIVEENIEVKFTAADMGITEEDLKAEPIYGKTINIMSGAGCTCGPLMANELGYFDDFGINVDVTRLQSNYNEALATDQVQLVVTHLASSLVPIANDLDVYYKSAAISGCLSLYALNDSEFETTSDFPGKTIGTNEFGGHLYNVALRFFARDGVDTSDMNLIPVETASSVLALENGEIDGLMLSDQFANPFVEDGTLKRIRSLSYDEDFHIEPCCANMFSGQFARENPKHAELINQIVKDAQAWIEDNEEEAVQILFDKDYASGDFDLLVQEFKAYSWVVPDVNIEQTIENMVNDYKEFGIIREDVDTKALMEKCWHPAEKDSFEGLMVSPNDFADNL